MQEKILLLTVVLSRLFAGLLFFGLWSLFLKYKRETH